MQYTWDARSAFELASLPKAAAAQMKLANALQLRVLIWLACVGQGRFDAAACAVSCGATPEMCEEAVHYWVDRGVVSAEGMVSAPAVVSATTVTATPAVLPPVTLPVQPTGATRPSRTQVLEVQANDERFAFLLQTAEAKLGKSLSPADMAVYLYLYRDIGLPPEVIVMIIGYAVKNDKAKLSYIEKTALNWADAGIKTIDAADKHLCYLERCETAFDKLNESLSLGVMRPTLSQKQAACRWVYDWKLPQDVIETAVRYTVDKIGKFQASYTDRVLERLHALGITTVDAAREELEPKKAPRKYSGRMKTADDRPPSFDLEQYEAMTMRHRPLAFEEEEEG